jgi:hypothetical protein
MLQNLFPVYKYLRAVIIAVLPILIILFSINIGLTDAQLHKESLKNSNFYNDLSAEFKTFEPEFDSKNAFLSLVVASTVNDFASPGWIQNLAEKNIDQTTSWLRGDQENWNPYVPTQDINLAVTDKLDAKTREFSEKYQSNIPVCSESQENDLKQNGFKTDQNFCLPSTVKEGTQSLSEFFAFDKNSTNQNFFDTIFKSSLADVLVNEDQNWYKWFNSLRNYFVWQRNIIPGLLALVIVAIGLLILIAKAMGKKPLNELRSILIYTGYSILLLSTTIILVVGGGSYLTSSFGLQFLPSFSTPKFVSILSWQITMFSFNILSLAIYTALILFLSGLVTWFLAKLGFLKFIKVKNQKLVANPLHRNAQNKTLDGQFKESNLLPNRSSVANFQNLDIAENFEMPTAKTSQNNTFNIDVLSQTPNATSTLTQNIVPTVYQSQESSESLTIANDYTEEKAPEVATSPTSPEPTQINPSQPGKNDLPKKPLTWF